MRRIGWLVLAAVGAAANAQENGDTIGYPTIEAAIAALRADPAATFEMQQGWTVAANREGGNPVQWFFTPSGHPAHPAVVKRTAIEAKGTGYIDLAAFCYAPESECYRLIDDFRQRHVQALREALPREIALDVGIALNDHPRARVHRLLAEEGQAAEIRMDDLMKVIIVPTIDEGRGVLLWTAVYEFANGGYELVGEPTMVAPGDGTADLSIASGSGNTFHFAITPLVAARGREDG